MLRGLDGSAKPCSTCADDEDVVIDDLIFSHFRLDIAKSGKALTRIQRMQREEPDKNIEFISSDPAVFAASEKIRVKAFDQRRCRSCQIPIEHIRT